MARLGVFVCKGDNDRQPQDPQEGQLVIFLTYKLDDTVVRKWGYVPQAIPTVRQQLPSCAYAWIGPFNKESTRREILDDLNREVDIHLAKGKFPSGRSKAHAGPPPSS